MTRGTGRRLCLAGLIWALALDAAAAEPILDRLTIVAPAAPGGGWDQTARAMQHALLVERIARVVDVENIPGAAGTIGLADFVSNQSGRGDAVIVTGLVMLAAILWNDSTVSLSSATPLARLIGEFEVIAVPSTSPIRTMADLIATLKANPSAVSWGGGSAGGTDHLLAGLITDAAGLNPRSVNYIPFSGGGEAVTALLGGSVTAGVSGYGELLPHLQSGRLRPLGIAAATRTGRLDMPTLREQGIPVELPNWRGVMAAPGLEAGAKDRLDQAIAQMVRSPTWQRTLKEREWDDMYLSAGAFSQFLDAEQVRITPLAMRLRGGANAAAGGLIEWLFPALVGGASLAIAILLVVERRRRTPIAATPVTPLNRRSVLYASVGLGAYLATMYAAGFIVASTALFMGVAAAFGRQRLVRSAIVGIAFATVIFIAFTHGLGLELPAGPLARWIP